MFTTGQYLKEAFGPAYLANWFSGAITAGAALIAAVSLRVIERQTAVAERTLLLQFRPKIVVRSGYFDGRDVVFTITNVGSSSAYVDILHFHFTEMNVDSARNAEMNDGPRLERPVPMAPGETHRHNVAPPANFARQMKDAVGWAKEYPEDWLRVQTRIYCLGLIRYKDEAAIDRETGILRRYDARENLFIPSGTNDWEHVD